MCISLKCWTDKFKRIKMTFLKSIYIYIKYIYIRNSLILPDLKIELGLLILLLFMPLYESSVILVEPTQLSSLVINN